MINADIRKYNYSQLGTIDEYGQETFNPEQIDGQLKAAIYPITAETTPNINYSEATYILITKQEVSDNQIIHYTKYERLKVIKVLPNKKYKVAYLKEYEY